MNISKTSILELIVICVILHIIHLQMVWKKTCPIKIYDFVGMNFHYFNVMHFHNTLQIKGNQNYTLILPFIVLFNTNNQLKLTMQLTYGWQHRRKIIINGVGIKCIKFYQTYVNRSNPRRSELYGHMISEKRGLRK